MHLTMDVWNETRNLRMVVGALLVVSLRPCAGADSSGVTPSMETSAIASTPLDLGSTAERSIAGDNGGAQPAPSVLNPMIIRATGAAPAFIEHVEPAGQGVAWSSLFRASGRFLAIEHGFRLLTEQGTRDGLKGSFIQNYVKAVSSLHGWSDGDEFYVNYVGHSMQGSVASFLWVQNDRQYRTAEFGANKRYWKSRLRAAAFAWAYSTQFEIGPFSEASIGAVQAVPPQQGFVDHVITPTVGLGWTLAEDAVDKHLIQRIEGATTNIWIRLLARSTLNPSRTFANVLQGNSPWRRESREGITSYRRPPPTLFNGNGDVAPGRKAGEPQELAPFEFVSSFQTERLWGTGRAVVCVGGSGSAAIRIAPAWQVVMEVGGCKMLGLNPDLSGDSLSYMAGPRWAIRSATGWTGHWQLLAGGQRMVEERIEPECRQPAALQCKSIVTAQAEFPNQVDAHGFSVAVGGGVDYQFNKALGLRLVELSYRHSWIGPLWGATYSNGLRLGFGLALRMGSW